MMVKTAWLRLDSWFMFVAAKDAQATASSSPAHVCGPGSHRIVLTRGSHARSQLQQICNLRWGFHNVLREPFDVDFPIAILPGHNTR